MCCLDESTLGIEFHIMHISSDNKLHHIIIVRDPLSGGFVFADEVTTEDEKMHEKGADFEYKGANIVYTGVVDFLKAQSRYSFSIGSDCRSYATIAVADRGNRRVQVIRMYWEKSDFYQPSAHVLFVLGGSNTSSSSSSLAEKKTDRHMDFADIVSVAYSKGGELLAICDSGSGGAASAIGKIYILSGHSMELLRTVSTGFFSDAAIFRRKKEEALAAKKSSFVATVHSAVDDPFDTIDAANSSKSRRGTPRPTVNLDSSPPCSVAISLNGNLAVGYRNGGTEYFTLTNRLQR